MTDEAATQPPKKPRRRWRWLRRLLVAIFTLLLLVVVAVVVVVRSLDRPFIKRHVQEAVRSAANLELDYGATHVGLGGVRLEDIVVLQPEKFRPLAKELVRLGVLEVHFTYESLKGNGGPLLTGVMLENASVALVIDTTRGGTLDALSSPPDPKAPPPPPSKPTPLSLVLADLLAKPLPLARADVSGLGLMVVLSDGGRERERLSLKGVGLQLVHDKDPAVGWRLAADLGTPKAPLDLAFERAGKGSAKLKLALQAFANSSSAKAALDLKVVEQSLIQDLAVDRLLGLEAAVKFDAKAGKTEVTLSRFEAADGSVALAAGLTLPDRDGSPLLREATGEVDLAAALRHVPKGLVSIPVELEAGKLSLRVKDLLLSGMPSLLADGSAGLDAQIKGFKLALENGSVKAPALLELSVDAKPKDGTGLGGHAKVSLEKLQVDLGGKRVDVDAVELGLDASHEPDGAWNGKLDLQLGKLANAIGATVDATGARLGLKVQALQLDLDAPLEAKGKVELDFGSKTLTADVAKWKVRSSGLGLSAKTQLVGGAPYAIDLDVPAEKLSVSGPGTPSSSRSLADTPLKLHVGLKETFLDLDRPLKTRGIGQVTLDLGTIHLGVDITRKVVETAEFTLALDAATVAALKTLAPEAADYQLPWDKLALSLRTAGKLEKLFTKAPTLAQKTDLKVDKLALTLPSGTGGADHVELGLKSDGGFTRQTADLDLAVNKLSVSEKGYGDGKLTLSAVVDTDAPSLKLALKGGGDAGPDLSADVTASFDRAAKALTYQVALGVARIGVLAPVIKVPSLDLTKIAATVDSSGTLAGVVDEIGADGTFKLAPKPLETLVGKSRYEIKLEQVSWASGDQEAEIPSLSLKGSMDTPKAGQHTVRGELDAASIHYALGPKDVDLGGVHDSIEITSSDLLSGVADLGQTLDVATVKQQWLPDYPTGAMTLAINASRDREGTIRASLVRLDNRAAGTVLKLDGVAELGGYRRALSLHGILDQDLSKVWKDKELLEAKGKLSLDVRLDSNDLRVYHAEAQAKFEKSDLKLSKAGITVEALDAEIPTQVDFTMGEKGFQLRTQANADAFSQLRFADQHPFHSRRSFLSIGKLTSPAGVMSPIAGNLEFSRGVLLLSQLELGVRKGTVTGQCALILGKDQTVVARVRASDVESSYGEPFDGNLAVSVSMKERKVEGRAEILRIGKRHLLDLLDFQDPYHADASFNQIRTALNLGYPDHVRLTFRQGFASLDVTFGGVASVVKIDEIRGIPVGPLLDKVMAGMKKDAD